MEDEEDEAREHPKEQRSWRRGEADGHGRGPQNAVVIATSYLRAAQAYMLISIPTGTSTIFGVFQVIFYLLSRGTTGDRARQR
jgi:hypothetical protein